MSLLLNKFVISNNKKNASTFTSQGNERVNLKNHILWFNFLLIIHTNYMAVYIRTSAEKDCSSPRRFFIQQFPFQEFPLRSLPHQPLWPRKATKTTRQSIQLLPLSSKSCPYFLNLKFISPLITNVPLCMFITHSHFNQSAHKQLKAYIKDLSF